MVRSVREGAGGTRQDPVYRFDVSLALSLPPNKALQLPIHSRLQSVRDTVWRRTLAFQSSGGGTVARS